MNSSNLKTLVLELSCVHVRNMKVNRILHGKSNCPTMHAPRQVKMTLIWYLLPHLVPKQRSLPVMAQLAPGKTIHCHALAVAKKREGSYETVALSTDKGNRSVEHLKLAHVSGEKWVVHPGTSLSPSLLFVTVIPEEPRKANAGSQAASQSSWTRLNRSRKERLSPSSLPSRITSPRSNERKSKTEKLTSKSLMLCSIRPYLIQRSPSKCSSCGMQLVVALKSM